MEVDADVESSGDVGKSHGGSPGWVGRLVAGTSSLPDFWGNLHEYPNAAPVPATMETFSESYSGPVSGPSGLLAVPMTSIPQMGLRRWMLRDGLAHAQSVRVAFTRADSGRRYFFRPVTVRHQDAVQATVFCIRLYDCVFPERGIYFLELCTITSG